MLTKERSPLGILKTYFGFDGFRKGQEPLINSLLSGRDAMGIMPTGAGKSLCYQVPALAMDGITLVISPLISLMKDQVEALIQAGVKAAYINSSLTPGQIAKATARAREGQYKIIYIAPERLLTDDFLYFAKKADIALVAVDEAHCISQWGQDFRPSYLKIRDFIAALPKRPPVGAFTATATAEVRQDIAQLLGLAHPTIEVTGFDRENLYFSVQKPKDKFQALGHIVARHARQSGIVYCSTRKTVEQVCEKLTQRGIAATMYHAGLPDEQRRNNQDDFIYDRKPIIVATNAFGMGIDKSNVSFVVHYNMPKNLESYYQEAGRAGRDGQNAQCVLLYSANDVRTCQYFIDHPDISGEIDEQTRALIRQGDMQRLRQMVSYCTTTECLRAHILNYFGEAAQGACGNCGNCQAGYEATDVTDIAQKVLICVLHLEHMRRSFGRKLILDVLRGSKSDRIKQLGLDKIPSHASLKGEDAQRLGSIVDFMIDKGLLAQVGEEYPVLQLTDASMQIIHGTQDVNMLLPAMPEKAKEGATNTDEGLFGALKALRAQFAAQKHVPAYIVFSDATLRDMCAKLPRTLEDMLGVSGVGEAKFRQYGEAFLAAIGQHIADGDAPKEELVAPVQRKGQPWAQQEISQLRLEMEEGLSIAQICMLHGRTRGAIRAQLRKMDPDGQEEDAQYTPL